MRLCLVPFGMEEVMVIQNVRALRKKIKARKKQKTSQRQDTHFICLICQYIKALQKNVFKVFHTYIKKKSQIKLLKSRLEHVVDLKSVVNSMPKEGIYFWALIFMF